MKKSPMQKTLRTIVKLNKLFTTYQPSCEDGLLYQLALP